MYQPPSHELDRAKLAAFIDGSLSGAERDAVLARVADSPTDMAIIADTLAVQAELDADVKDIRDYAPQTRWSRTPRMTKWMGIAASLIAVVALPLMPYLASFSTADGYASLLTSKTVLAAGWDAQAWSVTRGAKDGIPERVRAVRVGALTSAIDVAVARGDSATPRLASQVAALLEAVAGARNVILSYRSIAASGNAVQSEQVRDARHAARTMVTATAFDDGAWLEAAHIAASGRDSAFFAARASRVQLDQLMQDTAGDARAQNDVQAVSRLIETKAWDAVAATTNSILASLATP
jgi:hypothetical protein